MANSKVRAMAAHTKLSPRRSLGRLLSATFICAAILAFGLLGYSAEERAPSTSDGATEVFQDCVPNESGRLYKNLPAPWAKTTNSEIVHTRIGGRDFYVPRNYFRHPQIGCGAEEPAMLLRVLLPDLKPYSEEIAAEFEAQRGFGSKLNILLKSHPPTRPLEELVELYIEDGAVEKPAAATHGLMRGRHRHGDDVFTSRANTSTTRHIRRSRTRPDRGALSKVREHLETSLKYHLDRDSLRPS